MASGSAVTTGVATTVVATSSGVGLSSPEPLIESTRSSHSSLQPLRNKMSVNSKKKSGYF